MAHQPQIHIEQLSFDETKLDLINQFIHQIPEFERKTSTSRLQSRLMDKPNLILVAIKDHQIIGFKLGYQINRHIFYSWLGAVHPNERGCGIAQMLFDEQEKWAMASGYRQIKVRSKNSCPQMIRLLIKNGYLIEKYEENFDILSGKIHFCKRISKR